LRTRSQSERAIPRSGESKIAQSLRQQCSTVATEQTTRTRMNPAPSLVSVQKRGIPYGLLPALLLQPLQRAHRSFPRIRGGGRRGRGPPSGRLARARSDGAVARPPQGETLGSL